MALTRTPKRIGTPRLRPSGAVTTPQSITQPFRQLDWPLPPQPQAPATDFHSWTCNPLTLRLTHPFHQTEWPLPPRALTTREDWTQNPTTLRLTRPFRQTDWPLPTPSIQPSDLASWTQNLLQSTLKPVLVTPHNQYDWPLPPPGPKADIYSWVMAPPAVLGLTPPPVTTVPQRTLTGVGT